MPRLKFSSTYASKRKMLDFLVRHSYKNVTMEGFPGGAVVKNLPANAGDTGSSPGPGRSHMQRSN